MVSDCCLEGYYVFSVRVCSTAILCLLVQNVKYGIILSSGICYRDASRPQRYTIVHRNGLPLSLLYPRSAFLPHNSCQLVICRACRAISLPVLLSTHLLL